MKQQNMEEFSKAFEEVLFPTIKGKDGNGIEKFKKIVEEKRISVQNRRNKGILK